MYKLSTLVLLTLLAAPGAMIAQAPAEGQPGSVPVTSQTPSSPNAPATTTTGAPATTKGERKEQRKQQKMNEKSAKDTAKSAKANSKALKAQDKATDAAQKAQPQ